MKKYWVGVIILTILVAIPVTAYSDAWTFMVYLDGDNNLESYAIYDFLEMAEVGSDININIIVQFDRITGHSTGYGDWKTCHRFKITYNMEPTEANAIADWGDGSGGGREVNMGHPDTLSNFVNWATTNYPATRYALILWNHGSGWRARAPSEEGLILKAVCWDDTSNDRLEMREVRSALQNITEHMHLIGFDACLMGMIEVAHQIYIYGDVMVASEAVEPVDGWPYDDILADLVATPSMDASALGTQIVTDYMAHSITRSYTQSAIDLSTSKISALTSALDSFVQVLGYDVGIAMARTYSEEYQSDPFSAEYHKHIDLYYFAYLCQYYNPYNSITNPALDSRAQTVMDSVTSAVIASGGPMSWYTNAHGLAIYFPEDEDGYDSDYESPSVNTFSSTQWDEFLHNYYNQVPPPGGDGGTTGTGGSSGGKVCFIATAAYTSHELRVTSDEKSPLPVTRYPLPDHPITVLQKFRDEYLLTNAPGRAFVSCYEKISPPVAEYIQNKESLKVIIRLYLKPVVWIAKRIVKE